MRQIKIFKSDELGARKLEKTINDWIRSENIQVVQIFGNIAPQTGTPNTSGSNQYYGDSDVLLIVLYETADAGTAA